MQINHILGGKNFAVLMTDGVERIEFLHPLDYFTQRGARFTAIVPRGAGQLIQAYNGTYPAGELRVGMDVRDARCENFDVLLIPGGLLSQVGLRLTVAATAFIRAFGRDDKPIGATSHGPGTLIESGIASGHRLTSWPGLAGALRDSGAEWVNESVVVDGLLITAGRSSDLPAFEDALFDQVRGTQAQTLH